MHKNTGKSQTFAKIINQIENRYVRNLFIIIQKNQKTNASKTSNVCFLFCDLFLLALFNCSDNLRYGFDIFLAGFEFNVAARFARYPRVAERSGSNPGPTGAHLSVSERVGRAQRTARVGAAHHFRRTHQPTLRTLFTYR